MGAHTTRSRRGGLRLWIGRPTLIRADQRPAELLGWGPIHAELAADLARSLRSWWCVLTDTAGAPQALIPLRRRTRRSPRPSAATAVAGEVWIQVDPDTLRILTALAKASGPPSARLDGVGWQRGVADRRGEPECS